jgi:hypothetical protein
MTSLRKEIVDSRVLDRGRHQVIKDYHVSHSGIEEVVAVQIHRDASMKFYSWEHALSDDVVEGLTSLVQPDDPLRWRRHLGPTVCSRVLTKYVFPQPVGPVMFAVNGCRKQNSLSTSLVAVVVGAVVTAVDIHDCLYVCIGAGDGGEYARWLCGYG